MSAVCQSDITIIDRVHIRAASTEAVAVRQRVERALCSATLRTSRLPCSAILIVRKLRDVTPTSRLSGYNRTQILEWERALNAELNRLAAEAVRGSVFPVPASAEAVLFADRAEMLACLALDWLQGTLRNNWWWFSLLNSDGADSVVAREWSSSPEFVPLALEYLTDRSQAITLMARMSDELTRVLLNRVMHIFGILPSRKSRKQQIDAARPRLVPDKTHLLAETSSVAEPWSPVVPEANATGLTPLKRIFLAQALMLRRAPAHARSVAFQTAIADWHAATDENALDPSHSLLDSDPNTPRKSAVMVASHGGVLTDRETAESHGTGAHPASKDDSRFKAHAGKSTESVTDRPHEMCQVDATDFVATHGRKIETRFAGNSADFGAGQREIESHHEAVVGRSDAGCDPNNVATTASEPSPGELSRRSTSVTTQQKVQSAFGGVFFLVNVALALGLYSDFTAPQGENLELDPWDFLWLLALRFVGEDILTDSLKPLLAALAGRTTPDHIGANSRPPQNWEIPPAWLQEFPESFAYKETVSEGRRQIAHPAGFLLKDEAQVPTNAAGGLERWIDWISAYVRARLARAIGREDGAEFLCRIPGGIEITAMRVDVYYSLQTHPTEIRLAGLDRDPGWVPAAGRYVAYHFD